MLLEAKRKLLRLVVGVRTVEEEVEEEDWRDFAVVDSFSAALEVLLPLGFERGDFPSISLGSDREAEYDLR